MIEYNAWIYQVGAFVISFRTTLILYRISQLYESILYILNLIHENETIRAGISSWIHQLDTVAKYYTANNNRE